MAHATDLPDLEALTAEALDDLPDLDDLLHSAKAEAADKSAAKTARERLAKGGLTPREREEDLARLRDWEARNLYRAVANVACFTESSCDRCGDYTYLFTGLMERQVHRHVETTQRWLVVDKIKTDLDNEVRVTRQTTPFCLACMTEVGFSFNNAYTEDGEELQAAEDEPAAADLDFEILPQPSTSDEEHF